MILLPSCFAILSCFPCVALFPRYLSSHSWQCCFFPLRRCLWDVPEDPARRKRLPRRASQNHTGKYVTPWCHTYLIPIRRRQISAHTAYHNIQHVNFCKCGFIRYHRCCTEWGCLGRQQVRKGRMRRTTMYTFGTKEKKKVPQDGSLGIAKDPKSSASFSGSGNLYFRVSHVDYLENPLWPWLELHCCLLLNTSRVLWGLFWHF